MKEVGINRAFIGNIGLDDVPYGDIKMLSDEWWECIHLALKTATELDIEIGVFNSPGWSQSGGPWVKAENAMRYLSASEMKVSGPAYFSQKLEQPDEHFQDVKVLAFPVPKYWNTVLPAEGVNISSSPGSTDLKNLIDGDTATSAIFPDAEKQVIDIKCEQAFTARSLTLHYPARPLYTNVTLQVENDSGELITHKVFDIDRTKFDLNVGFKPLAPFQVSFKAITTTRFRLIFDYLEHGDWPVAMVNKSPELNEIVFSSGVLLENFAEKSLAKMHPTPLPKFKDYYWAPQPEPDDQATIIDPSQVVDLSDKVREDGTLNWNIPAGDWLILRTGMTPTGVKNSPASPEATGFEVDKMSREHVEKHFYGHIGEILRRIPEEDRKTFKVVVQDSYEKGGQNITDGFFEEFRETYGYDPVPFIPTLQGLVVESQLASDRFLWDMRRLVADKVAYDYVGGLKKISNRHGLVTWLENYGHWGFPSEFLMYGGQSDEIAGEFWSEGSLGDIENRAAISCGHIYHKKRIWAESFTCAHRPFSRSPAMLKPRGDRFFAEGINSTLLHVYIHQPYEDRNPGVNAWFGNPFNRKNTWFYHSNVFIDYLKRSNYMLQQGLNVADVAYFIGEDAPIMTGEANPPLPPGYEFDYINAEVIMRDMTIENGFFTLPHGTQYRILVLPKLKTMRPELLKKIRDLVAAGGVVLGPPPLRSPSGKNQPHADHEVVRLAADLWDQIDGKKVKVGTYGQGVVMHGMTMEEAFDYIRLIPDCKVPQDTSIHYGHRKTWDTEIYFLSNQTDQKQLFIPEFRVSGKQPELWQATTGETRFLPSFQQKGETTAVPIKLEPFESVFVVFNKKSEAPGGLDFELNYPEHEVLVDLNEDWIVEFDPSLGGPEKPVVFKSLYDWTISGDDRIKYYAGMATYRKSFDIKELNNNKRLLLDLGNLTAMAKVRLNGKEVGGVWTPPYTLDITNLAMKGTNELEIEVVNNWMNRLIGDAGLPKEQRLTWSTFNTYTVESKLQPSGLFGPVHVSGLMSSKVLGQ